MMILTANPIFEEHVDLPGKHTQVRQIDLNANLSNSRVVSHSRPTEASYYSSVPGEQVFHDVIDKVCQERFSYNHQYIPDEDVTRISLKWEHVHDGFYEEPLLGQRHLKITTDVGVFNKNISLKAKLSKSPVEVIISDKEDAFLMKHGDTTYHHVDLDVDRNQKTLVEFWYVGNGDILVHGEPILDVDKYYKTLSDFRVTKEIKPKEDRPQKFKIVVPAGGNRLRVRWNPQNSQNEDFRVYIYDLSVTPIYSKQENLTP